ncbi:MAG: hypothetical protein ACLQVY_09660 [Limisphaerales bacterium]
MSEFKFSCPHCQQNIQATPEYSGTQITCPSCQNVLVVPPAPEAPAPPHGARLTMAASTTNHPVTATPRIAGVPIKKKKDYTNMVASLLLAGCAIAAAIYFGPSLYKKYISHQEAVAPAAASTAAAAASPTNEPAAPPPELSTEDILQKVADTYSGLDSYGMKGALVSDIDASAVNPGAGATHATATVSLQLGRTNFYRMEWERSAGGREVKGVAWNSGKGDFVGFGQYAPGKVKNRQAALSAAADSSGALCAFIAEMFFGDTNSLATHAEVFAKTNGPSINGQSCYVLNGQLNAHNIVLWVDKKSFLIPQIEFDYGGKLDTLTFKALPLKEREKLTRMSKLKGNVVETYQNMDSNPTLTAASFETTYTPAAPEPARGRRQSGPAPGRGTATQITRRVMQPQQPQ